MSQDPTVEQRASEMGWRDQASFKGDPEAWVDAEEYVRRGEQVLPLVKAENRRLVEKQDKLTAEIARLTAVVSEQRGSMDEIVKFNAEQLAARLAEQKRQIKAELREARREEDDTAVEALEERLEENAEAAVALKAKTAAAPPPPPNTPPPVTETPEYKAWLSDNSWYGGNSRIDQAKTAAAQRFGVEAAAAGKRGEAFFKAVDEAMAEVYPPQRRQEPSEEGRPSGGGGSGASGDSSFNGLPSEARAKAKEQVSRFVGPNKMFKDEKAWYAYYTKQYRASEAA